MFQKKNEYRETAHRGEEQTRAHTLGSPYFPEFQELGINASSLPALEEAPWLRAESHRRKLRNKNEEGDPAD